MIIKVLFSYIIGYLEITIEGYYIERFINVCISKGIFLWNVKIETISNLSQKYPCMGSRCLSQIYPLERKAYEKEKL